MAPGYPGYDACGDGGCAASCCDDGTMVGNDGALPPAKTNPPKGPNFTPPMPTPVDANPLPMSMYRPGYAWGNQVMPTGYQPMYYPRMNAGYWPSMPMGGYPVGAQPGMNAFSGNN
jgi:hypothetical protein